MSDETYKRVFVALHNVQSVNRLVDTAQVVYGLGFPSLVVSKAEGSAAQTGIPDANKIAIKMNRSFMVLPDLSDVLELLEIKEPLLITSPMLSKEQIDFDALTERLIAGQRVLIVFSGCSSSFSRREMDMGRCYSIESNFDIGPVGSAAIVLYELTKRIQSLTSERRDRVTV